MRDADERLADEQRHGLYKGQRKLMARWVAHAVGLGAQEFPQVMRAFGRALFQDYLAAVATFDERLAKLESLVERVEKLEARLDKASKVVGELKQRKSA